MFSVDSLDFDFESEHSALDPSKDLNVFRMPLRVDDIGEKENLPTPPKRPHLSSPIRNRSSCPDGIVTKAVQRKFPGPAGLLPDKPPRSFNDSSFILEHIENNTTEKAEEPILCSQASESAFSEPSYRKLRKDFNVDAPDSPLSALTINWVKKKALSKGLKGRKIPFLAVILQSIDCSTADPVLTLRDPTGELLGAIHHESWKELGDKLRPGAAIALKEIGVLSTGVSRHEVVLSMTKNNIVTVYSAADDGGGVEVSPVRPTSNAEIVRSVADWQAKAAAHHQSPVSAPGRSSDLYPSVQSPSSNLFKTVSHSSAAGTPVGPTYSRAGPRPFRPGFIRNNIESPITARTENSSEAEPPVNASASNFDLFPDDEIFADLGEVDINSSRTEISKTAATEPPTNTSNIPKYTTSRVLSQVETSILEEVLSGVDFDDFD